MSSLMSSGTVTNHHEPSALASHGHNDAVKRYSAVMAATLRPGDDSLAIRTSSVTSVD
jgi:hypothetical protein